MKYIKLFMLLAFVSVFAACSDDDYNTNGSTTVSFASATFTTKESAGIVNIPINVEGARNGNVKVVVKAEEVGDSPAKEDVNYLITDKTLNLNADTLTTGTLNVETKIVDDSEVNADRTFKLTIVQADGAKIGENASVLVTIRDNESAFYEQFFGTWTVTGKDNDGNAFSSDITISGETNESAADYNKILSATASNFFSIGPDLTFNWHFAYSYDETTQSGTIGWVMNETVSSYGTAYTWVWLTDDGSNFSTEPITGEWKLTEDKKLPTVITFPKDATLYMVDLSKGWFAYLTNIKMTKK